MDNLIEKLELDKNLNTNLKELMIDYARLRRNFDIIKCKDESINTE